MSLLWGTHRLWLSAFVCSYWNPQECCITVADCPAASGPSCTMHCEPDAYYGGICVETCPEEQESSASEPTGACCDNPFSCKEESEVDCQFHGGNWQEGQTCESVCPLGSCCHGDSDHCELNITEKACHDNSGSWHHGGDCSICTTSECTTDPETECAGKEIDAQCEHWTCENHTCTAVPKDNAPPECQGDEAGVCCTPSCEERETGQLP
ncbi:MAG: hypothetical protein PHO92_04725 [Candidatus Peribacteraceae bacterium]|nr:hypothetical protein [Candidatus Peribacteraceae bacterium]